MWLSAALSVIAFTVATRVRAETERASTTADGVRAYYLASGAIDRAILWMVWNVQGQYKNPDGSQMFAAPPMPRMPMAFPGGWVTVEAIPEGGKLNINNVSAVDLDNLLASLGLDRGLAAQLTAEIIDWRSATGGAGPAGLNFGPGSTFRPRHASLEELEELLLIPGMTPDIFYGRYDHDDTGRLIPRGGLRDCLTVWGGGKVDINTAPVALLQSLGIPPDVAAAIVIRRQRVPFGKMEEVNEFVSDAAIRGRLGIGGATIWTFRATARVRTANGTPSDLKKTVAAVVKFLEADKWDPPYHILRWYDDAWSPAIQAN